MNGRRVWSEIPGLFRYAVQRPGTQPAINPIAAEAVFHDPVFPGVTPDFACRIISDPQLRAEAPIQTCGRSTGSPVLIPVMKRCSGPSPLRLPVRHHASWGHYPPYTTKSDGGKSPRRRAGVSRNSPLLQHPPYTSLSGVGQVTTPSPSERRRIGLGRRWRQCPANTNHRQRTSRPFRQCPIAFWGLRSGSGFAP